MAIKVSKERQRAIILNKLAKLKDSKRNYVIDLHCFIRWAMGIEPVRYEMNPHGYWYGKIAIYSEEDEAKVDLVIRHLEEQGYIKIKHNIIKGKRFTTDCETFEVTNVK